MRAHVLCVGLVSLASACSLVEDVDRFNKGGPLADAEIADSNVTDRDGDVPDTSSSDAPTDAASDAPPPKAHVFAVGGVKAPTSYVKAVDVGEIDPTDGSVTWTGKDTLPSYASACAAATNGTFAYVFGGDIYDGTNKTARFAKLEGGVPTGWASTTPMPDQRIKLAAAVTDTYAYIIGGDIAGKPSSEVHKAPINADGSLGEWARTADLPEQRTGACAARYQNHIYVVGGGGGGTDYASVRRGDAGPDGAIAAWSLETMGLSSSVSGASCVIHGNRLYVVGGYGHLTKVSQATLAPDGKISSWLGDVEMKHAHAYFAAAAAGEFLYAIGGFDSSSTMPSETDVVEVAKFTSSGLGPFTLTTPLPGGTRHFLTGFGTP